MFEFFCGVFAVIAIQALLLYNLYQTLTDKSKKPQSNPDREGPVGTVAVGHTDVVTLPHIHKEPYPALIVDFLRTVLTPVKTDLYFENANSSSKEGSWGSGDALEQSTMSKTETSSWANILAHRYFIELRASDYFKAKLKNKLSDKINMKLAGNSFVYAANITDINLGINPPNIKGVRVLKGFTTDLAVILEVDVTYAGGISILLSVDTVGGVKIPVTIAVSSLSGKLRVRTPSTSFPDMLSVAFTHDPKIQFVVNSPITVRDNEIVRDMVNKLLGKIVRHLFLELWVLPNCRNFFLPLMEPSAGDDITRTETSAPIPKLSKLRGLLQKNVDVDDHQRHLLIANHLNCFSTESEIYENEINEMEKTLISSFISLAKDNGQPTLDDPAWKVIKNKAGVNIQKRRYSNGPEISRAFIRIQCDAERVYSILSSPAHLAHLDEAFLEEFNVVKQFDETKSVIESFYALSKNPKQSLTVFEVKKKLNVVEEENVRDADVQKGTNEKDAKQLHDNSFIVVCRSILPSVAQGEEILSPTPKQATIDPVSPVPSSNATPFMDSPSNSPDNFYSPAKSNLLYTNKVYVLGYLIEQSVDNSNACEVTMLSEFSGDLARFELNYNSCRKIKLFIEELEKLTSNELLGEGLATALPRKLSFGSSSEKLRTWLMGKGQAPVQGSSSLSSFVSRFGFKKDGTEFETSGEIALPSSPSSRPKATTSAYLEILTPSDSFEDSPFIRKTLGLKEDLEVHIPFATKKQELIWNFTAEYPIQISLTFQSNDITEPPPLTVLSLFPNETEDRKKLLIIPTTTINSCVSKGNIFVSSFPSGVFTFTFSNQSKKVVGLDYKIGLRNCALLLTRIGSNISSNVSFDFRLARKGILRYPLVLDKSIDCNLTPFISWMFSGNPDVFFGIDFAPFYFEDEKALIKAARIEDSNIDTTNQKSKLAARLQKVVNRADSPLTNILIPVTKYTKTHNQGEICILDKFGVFSFIFDNSLSVVSSKDLSISLTILWK